MNLSSVIARLAVALGAFACLAGPAWAAKRDRIYSYDAESENARTLARGGLTFVFRKGGLGGTRVLKVLSTQQRGTAELKPASEKELGPAGLNGVLGRKVSERDLYEILPGGQGGPLIKAACPYADRGWLAFGALKPRSNLVIHAIGRNLATGKISLCASMEFSWHGEWKLPTG